MSAELHPLAPHTLPSFIGAADGSDPLFSAITIILVLAVLGIGVGYLSLHAIPERLAHKHGNTQSQLIMVLALLALFTHNNIFWVVALILAVLKLPDFLTPIRSISDSLKKLTATDADPTPPQLDHSEEAR